MRSIAAQLEDTCDTLADGTGEFLKTYSKITRYDDPPGGVNLVANPQSWGELSDTGKYFQSQLLKKFSFFSEMMKTLLRGHAVKTFTKFEEATTDIRQLLEQWESTYHENIPSALAESTAAWDIQRMIIRALAAAPVGIPLIVPDTNALYNHPDLEQWRFDGIRKFRLVLVPTVISELDHHKDHHKNDDVKEKARKLVRMFKGYRARGRILDGVPLSNGVSEFMAVAIEPDFDNVPSWLSREDHDDRIVASFFAMIREHPSTPAAMVTRDMNMQNKLEFARIPFLEPPDPSPRSTPAKPAVKMKRNKKAK